MVDANGKGQGGGAQRPVRSAPTRSGPTRRFTTASASEPEPAPADAAPEFPEVVAEAVRLGYRVVKENLRQGRAAADRLKAGSYRADDATEDIAILGKRLIGLARDLGSSWFDLLAAVLDDPRLRDAVRSRGLDQAPRRPPADEPPASVTPVEVRGHPNASGEARLEGLADIQGPPQITPLRIIAGPADAPPILGARLGAQSTTGALAVIVPVPSEQSPGTYAGTIHDGGTQRLLGSISLTIPAP